ncbi:MAG: phosphatase PAP2 family protein [Candidatus Methylacidiphilales bacterium]|nr:phosphatase PAP2 family protein [Candidatus Methylacidiphilales bacterium]
MTDPKATETKPTRQILLAEFLDVYLSGLQRIGRGRWWIVGGLVALAAILVVCVPHDRQIQEAIAGPKDPQQHQLARTISFWGDYPTGIAPVALAIWALGVFLRRRSWRRAMIAVLLAATLAGIGANCLRLTLGRPRPSANLPDGLYGLQAKSKFHGFPSGHAATAFGSGGALAAAVPPLAIPSLALAASVGWSRMELGRHFLTDILAGSFIGLVFGVAFGGAARCVKHPNEEDPGSPSGEGWDQGDNRSIDQ